MEPVLSLSDDAGSLHLEERPAYLRRLVAPMDDMWAAFADAARHHALLVDGEVAGTCAVDDEPRVLRFHVRPAYQHLSTALLGRVITELGVRRMMVFTVDPVALSAALDLAEEVVPHTLLYAHLAEPEIEGLPDLSWAGPRDHGRIVDFQRGELGAPRDFLDGYVRERLERGELLLCEDGAGIVCAGELRRDAQQEGVAHIGLVVRESERSRGVGSRMLASLVAACREEGLLPHCSTEVSNAPARRAIERAGFRALHRGLRIAFPG